MNLRKLFDLSREVRALKLQLFAKGDELRAAHSEIARLKSSVDYWTEASADAERGHRARHRVLRPGASAAGRGARPADRADAPHPATGPGPGELPEAVGPARRGPRRDRTAAQGKEPLVTTVDIEAIRERSHAVGAALDILAVSPNPGHAANAHQAAVASATDVPLLLVEVERLTGEVAETTRHLVRRTRELEVMYTVRDDLAAEVIRLANELADARKAHQSDLREAGAELRDLNAQLRDARFGVEEGQHG